jgi:hypothetical protein
VKEGGKKRRKEAGREKRKKEGRRPEGRRKGRTEGRTKRKDTDAHIPMHCFVSCDDNKIPPPSFKKSHIEKWLAFGIPKETSFVFDTKSKC